MYAEKILHSGSLFSSLAFVLGSLNQKNTQEGRQIVLNSGLAFLQVFPQTQFSSSNCLPIIRRNCSSRGSLYFSSICFQSSSVVNPFLKSRNSGPLPSQKRGHWQSRSQGVNKALHIPAPAAGQCHRIMESKQIDSQFVKQHCSTLKTVYLLATFTIRYNIDVRDSGFLDFQVWRERAGVQRVLIQVSNARLRFINDVLLRMDINNIRL